MQKHAIYAKVQMTYKNEEFRRANNKKISDRRLAWLKKNGPCTKCGSNKDLEVDHINPSTKIGHNFWSWSKPRRDAEAIKCQALCSVCHRKKSAKESSDLQRGQPKFNYRKHSTETIKRLFELHFGLGLSQRAACKELGVSRSVLSDILYRGYRPELYEELCSGVDQLVD